MASVVSFAYGGGIGLVRVASAQGRPAAPAAAPATAPKIDAKKTFGDGLKKFNAGDFAGALTDFQTVDALKPTPQAAYHIGLCQDNLGHYAEAVTAYDRFLAAVPPKMAAQGDEIKRRADAIRALPGKIHVETKPVGANILVDGVAYKSLSPTDIELPPGKHTLKFSAEDRVAQEKAVDVTFASKQDVVVELTEALVPNVPVAVVTPTAPPPVAPPPPVEAKPVNSTVPALVTGGLAVVALGVGTIFGVMALSDKSDFDKNPTSGKADDGENHALIADMAFGVAVTLGVTSAVLFLGSGKSSSGTAAKLEPAKPKTKAFTITPSPYVTPHGGGAGALVRF